MGKKAIITGATGAIGIALINVLIERGYDILVLCREGSPRNDNIPSNQSIKRLYCNLENLSTIKNCESEEYSVFYHFGWDGTTSRDRDDLPRQVKNIQWSLDAVNLAKEFNCEVFIGAGSQAEYGRVEMPMGIDTPCFPENGYGISKLAAGQMTRLRAQELGIRHVWTRILSVYGPYDNSDSLIMYAIRMFLEGKTPKLTKCEQEWDYIYSKDAANALYLMAEKGKNGGIYPIGSGSSRPLREYIEEIREMVSHQIAPSYGEIAYKEKQPMYLCADITAMRKDIGFQTKYSFEEGIQETIEWVKQVQEEPKTGSANNVV